jgi:hypothetical protein
MRKTRLSFIIGFIGIICFTALGSAPRAHGAPPTCDPAAVAAVADGVEAACPCAGKTAPTGEVTVWKNHGGYVSCVARERNRLAKQFEVSKSCLHGTTRCAARSTCGKRDGFVTCRIPDVCSDPTPDGIAAGTCGDDPTIACDTAANCPVLSCSIKSSPDLCSAQSGIAGTGSCCD